MKNEPDRIFLISVHPRWARAFFLSQNPKTIFLQERKFWGIPPTGRHNRNLFDEAHRPGVRHSQGGEM
jgi:hypothetical protein